jgi:hypothetical protein
VVVRSLQIDAVKEGNETGVNPSIVYQGYKDKIPVYYKGYSERSIRINMIKL